jgi:hypothetical protein
MPRLGGRKSYHILMDDLKSMKIGRDYLIIRLIISIDNTENVVISVTTSSMKNTFQFLDLEIIGQIKFGFRH